MCLWIITKNVSLQKKNNQDSNFLKFLCVYCLENHTNTSERAHCISSTSHTWPSKVYFSHFHGISCLFKIKFMLVLKQVIASGVTELLLLRYQRKNRLTWIENKIQI